MTNLDMSRVQGACSCVVQRFLHMLCAPRATTHGDLQLKSVVFASQEYLSLESATMEQCGTAGLRTPSCPSEAPRVKNSD